ncbi:MAG TPA: CopG family antitoxin [Dehalococcoidia bacterium]|nr:CopG family antitoxin [Dehalococcoidia bacterium]
MVTKRQLTAEDWLKESDYWDSISVQELWETSEPIDEKLVDARPKKAVSLRLTEGLIADAKKAAKEMGIGYQTLFRMWLMDGLRRHRLQKLDEATARKRRTA